MHVRCITGQSVKHQGSGVCFSLGTGCLEKDVCSSASRCISSTRLGASVLSQTNEPALPPSCSMLSRRLKFVRRMPGLLSWSNTSINNGLEIQFSPQKHGVCTDARTNNDCESWHARLARKANSANLTFYKIIELLHREAVLVERCLNSLCDDKTQRITSKVTREINEKRLWGDFDCGAINEDELLRSCSRLYTPPIAPVLTDYTDQ